MRAVAAVAVALAAAGVVGGPPAAADEEATRACQFADERFAEISGMTYSLRHPGVLWVHADSGGGPYLYAVDGRTCRTIATVEVTGIEARDLEAIATGRDRKGRPVLWLADIGDNLDSWPQVWLHRIREPRALVDQAVSARTYSVSYRDRPHNAEALMVDPTTGRMWLVTKQLAHGRIYALPRRMSTSSVNVARPVARVGGLVTDAAVSPDGSRYVLRDYVDAEVFDGEPPGLSSGLIPLPVQPQGEAVTWTPEGDALLVASERDDRLMRVPVPRTAGAEAVATVPDADPSPSATATAAAPSAETAIAGLLPWLVGAGVVALGVLAIAGWRRARA
ncbi:MAG: WD40 repeat domain-containing protein [Actinomycetota bacterium]|nr:WD40 repeat domain-containing protein [Actinomycetota bacterium]